MKKNNGPFNSDLQELNDLINKPTHTPQEKRRFAFLQTACAAIRSGVAVEEVEDLYREDAAKRGGVKLPAKTAENPEARAWSEYASNPESVTLKATRSLASERLQGSAILCRMPGVTKLSLR